MIEKLEVIVPTYKSKDLTKNFVRSFEKFSPSDMEVIFHIVENSSDTSYMQESKSWAKNLNWYNNPDADNLTAIGKYGKGSWANAAGIDYAKDKVTSEYTFICHNDCLVTSRLFFEELSTKVLEGNSVVSVMTTSTERKLSHSAGTLVRSDILKEFGTKPDLEKNLDVVENLSEHALQRGLSVCVLDNTFNDKTLFRFCNGVWKDLGEKCGLDRVIDSGRNEVIYVHLGRGSEKIQNRYFKPGKVLYNPWVSICEEVLNN